jgi:hypothetical protein
MVSASLLTNSVTIGAPSENALMVSRHKGIDAKGQCSVMRHPVQSYPAIQCNGMLPPSTTTEGCAKCHPRWRRGVPRLG